MSTPSLREIVIVTLNSVRAAKPPQYKFTDAEAEVITEAVMRRMNNYRHTTINEYIDAIEDALWAELAPYHMQRIK